MYAAALEAGFSAADLHTMPFNRLVMVLRARAEMNAPRDPNAPRKATQQDIAAYLY